MKPVVVGDRVQASGVRTVFIVVALDDGWAWLKDAKGLRIQEPVKNLVRAP